MTESDLERIERELSISLPVVYRQTMLDFPVRACAGNEEFALWDSADGLIRLNRELRCEFSWPSHLYALGQPEGDDANYAIDLRDRAAPVWWVDHWDVEGKGSGPVEPSFAIWIASYSAELRSVLEGDRVDPDGTPKMRQQVEQANARNGCLLLALWAVSALFAVIGTLALLAWRA